MASEVQKAKKHGRQIRENIFEMLIQQFSYQPNFSLTLKAMFRIKNIKKMYCRIKSLPRDRKQCGAALEELGNPTAQVGGSLSYSW